MMAETDHSHFFAMRRGNDFGISNLKAAQLKAEPKYIERILYEINAYHKTMNRTVSERNHYSIVLDRDFLITSTSKEIADKAKSLGASVHSTVGPGHSSVQLDGTAKMVSVNEVKENIYEIRFSADQVKKIVRDYSLEASAKTLKRGHHQRVYNAINSM